MNTFLVGSRYFFNNMPDFHPKDTDYISFCQGADNFTWRSACFKNGCDNVTYVLYPKETMLQKAIELKDTYLIGSFLTKPVAEYLNLKVKDLKPLKDLLNKREYVAAICQAIIDNNEFVLTEKQLQNIYIIYKKYKKDESRRNRKIKK